MTSGRDVVETTPGGEEIEVKGAAEDAGRQLEADSRAPGIAVIILTFNQKQTTLNCLASLDEISSPAFHILVWDNGSSDGTAEAIVERFEDVLVHRHPVNLGVASGRNRAADLAIEEFNPSFLLFLDNDMIVESEFVAKLHQPFLSDPRVGQTQAKLRFLDEPERLNDGGGCRVEFWRGRTLPVGFGELDRGQFDTPRDCVACGGAMMVRVDVFKELNGFDEVFSPFGPEDLDFSMRLSEAGFRALFSPAAVAYHAVSHTFGADFNREYAQHKARHWFLLLRRHAPLSHRIAFWLIGAPYLAIRAGLREASRGNLKGFWGLVQGALDSLRPS